MSKTSKNEARQTVAHYSLILEERGVISEVEQEELRGTTVYTFKVFDPVYAYAVTCKDIKELAQTLSVLWSGYTRARLDLGMVDEQYL